MQKYFLAIQLFIAIIVITISCKREIKTGSFEAANFDAASEDTLVYDVFSLDTIDANCKIKYKFCANASVTYPVFITADKTLNDFLNKEITKIVLYKNDTNLYATTEIFVQIFFNEILEIKKQGNYDEANSEERMIRNISVREKIGKYISIENYNEIYEGGAHPNSSVLYKVFDIVNRKEIKLSDLLNANDTALLRIGEKHFRKNNELKTNTKLSDEMFFIFGEDENFEESKAYGKFHFNNNFAITKDGIEFQYNTYEIAPYAVGAPSFTIPYEEISPYLKLTIW